MQINVFLILFKYFIYLSFSLASLKLNQNINLTNYLGYWHQIYISPNEYTTHTYSKCIYYNYILELDKPPEITIIKYQINKKNIKQNMNSTLLLFEGKNIIKYLNDSDSYWIIKLGEQLNNKYQYSIVTNKEKLYLLVLVRNIDLFYTKYKLEVNDFLLENHYRYVNVNQINCNNN